MARKKVIIAAQDVPLRFLALAVLDELRMPMPAQMLRHAIQQRYGRDVSPKALSALVTAARQRTKLATGDAAVVPALDSMGHAIRGWYSNSAWALADRIVPRGYLHVAFARARAKLEGRDLPPSSNGTEATLVTAAIERISKQPQPEQLFGSDANAT